MIKTMIAGMILPMMAWSATTHAQPAQTPAPVADIPQTPAHLALADQVMDAMHARDMVAMMTGKMIAVITPLVVKGNEAHADEVRAIVADEFHKAMNARVDQMVAVDRDAYARRLNDGELRDLIAFYRSPTGAHLIALLPEIGAETMARGQQIGREAGLDALPRIIARMKAAQMQVPVT